MFYYWVFIGLNSSWSLNPFKPNPHPPTHLFDTLYPNSIPHKTHNHRHRKFLGFWEFWDLRWVGSPRRFSFLFAGKRKTFHAVKRKTFHTRSLNNANTVKQWCKVAQNCWPTKKNARKKSVNSNSFTWVGNHHNHYIVHEYHLKIDRKYSQGQPIQIHKIIPTSLF